VSSGGGTGVRKPAPGMYLVATHTRLELAVGQVQLLEAERAVVVAVHRAGVPGGHVPARTRTHARERVQTQIQTQRTVCRGPARSADPGAQTQAAGR
jgi:hypothetical protein